MLRSFLVGLACFSLAVACGSSETSSTKASPQTGVNEPEPPPDANGCCARDTTQSGCMNLGGHSESGSCFRTCDFWCSTNWRVEKDEHGCESWRYDMRAPEEGEDSTCIKHPKPDAGIDAGDAASDATSD